MEYDELRAALTNMRMKFGDEEGGLGFRVYGVGSGLALGQLTKIGIPISFADGVSCKVELHLPRRQSPSLMQPWRGRLSSTYKIDISKPIFLHQSYCTDFLAMGSAFAKSRCIVLKISQTERSTPSCCQQKE